MDLSYDTEFLDDGERVHLISIAIAADDGAEYYAVAAEAAEQPLWPQITRHDWLMKNVVPHLPLAAPAPGDVVDGGHSPRLRLDTGHPDVKPRAVIAREVAAFIQATPEPALWAYYGAHDFIALTQLWGRLIHVPDGVPWYSHELAQEIERLDAKATLPEQAYGHHHALHDARHNRAVLRHLRTL
ncbi:polyadenylate-specific 3'-exoribonuclease AS [Actinocorallia aurea]